MATLKLWATLSACLFLFFYGTGQSFCLCEESDYCNGVANQFTGAVSIAIAECCDASIAKVVVSTVDNCCSECPTSELSVSSIRINEASENHERMHNVPCTSETFRFGKVEHLSSAQMIRPPPRQPDLVDLPVYIVYRSILI